MFNAIPQQYDLVNRVITWGFDQRWRWLAARECLATAPRRVLDLGSGTGDLAISIVRQARNYVMVTALDFSEAMLAVAAQKAEAAVGKGRITFTHGEAGSLPFPDEHFDCVGISFAFRNLTYKNPVAEMHVAEIFRVLRPGGRCVIVETSQPKSKIVRWLFHFYLRWVVAWAGRRLSGNRGAYQYLAESAARFYTPAEIKEMLMTAGFRQVSYRPLLFGVAGIHVAVK
jgi:demethylmenaquinone methyltransferase/2-methoxy-6-polyprenyl-1,4-benzoquinol methylase